MIPQYRRTSGALAAAAALTGALLLAAPGSASAASAAAPVRASAVTPALTPAAATALQPECLTRTCVTDTRVGAHDGYDRIVFDLTGTALPVWDATVTTDDSYPTGEAGQIRHFGIQGSSYLRLRFHDMTSFDVGTGQSVYTTANPLATGLPSATGVQLYDDFEGYTSFAVTLGAYSHYNVFTLTAPDRVVVDVYH